ncbi:MAG TPA: Uma2 family endonuclease [Anaerolineae bacterium]|nr:Uma2 family endonuclease [Anaerolineae bacterium]
MQVLTPESTTTQLITGEELLARGDIGRCELVEGKIVMLSPTGNRHARIESRFDRTLGAYGESHGLGIALVGELGIYTHRNPDSVRAPDFAFVSKERAARVKSDGYLEIAPDLVLEVMSPDDRWTNVMKKLGEYLEIGVRVVLIAEPDNQRVSAYRSLTDVQIFNVNDVLTVEDVLPGFSVPISTLFEET